MIETSRKSSGTATKRKVIITCAVTGAIHTPSMSPQQIRDWTTAITSRK